MKNQTLHFNSMSIGKPMMTAKYFIVALLLCLVLAQMTLAQQAGGASTQDVTIIIQREQVRFTSQKPVQMMQLQIFNQAGEQVYDSGPMTVAEINWPLQAANGEALKSGLYAYTLSVQESGATAARVRRGHFIVDRAQDRDAKTDKLWVTSQNDSGIGTELTVARNEGGTVAGTSTPSDRVSGRTSTTDRETTQREVAARGEKTASPKTKATTEEAYDNGNRLEAVYPNTQIRFGNSYADNGGYLISTLPSQAIISGGGSWNGASWIAKAPAASLTAHQNGVIQFFTNGNLVPGGAFGPLERMRVDVNGNVGIGTQTPSYKLDVAGPVRALRNISSDMVVETTGGTNAWAKLWMMTPSQKWSIGTSQNYNGNQLYFHDANADKIRMAIQTNGNVGIGTTNPQVKLHVAGEGTQEVGVQSVNERAIFSLNSTMGGANRVWTLENGVNAKPGTFAIYDRTAGKERLTIDTEGNVKQSVETNGLVKAMAYVNGDGRILRCYNSMLAGSAATTGNCGIGVTQINPGIYDLYFGFNPSGRFISLTAQGGFSGSSGNPAGANYNLNSSSVIVTTFDTKYSESLIPGAPFRDCPFMIIIY